ncbi:MAG: hypothetical protein UW80_C0058G0006 [Microgenomates group bacterium GW2011_GWC1_44_9]|nr:MAG: hypothetical protein UW80_C0058G0006 [Microgenomates group bacterium GW2011_GWC1_44_9]
MRVEESHTINSPYLAQPLLLGFISILITNYFGFSVVNVALFFFLFPAIFLSHLGTNKIISKKINLNQSLGILLVLGTAWRTE